MGLFLTCLFGLGVFLSKNYVAFRKEIFQRIVLKWYCSTWVSALQIQLRLPSVSYWNELSLKVASISLSLKSTDWRDGVGISSTSLDIPTPFLQSANSSDKLIKANKIKSQRDQNNESIGFSVEFWFYMTRCW